MADNKTATTQVDLTCVKPYGDALNDGKVEMALRFRFLMVKKQKNAQSSMQRKWVLKNLT